MAGLTGIIGARAYLVVAAFARPAVVLIRRSLAVQSPKQPERRSWVDPGEAGVHRAL